MSPNEVLCDLSALFHLNFAVTQLNCFSEDSDYRSKKSFELTRKLKRKNNMDFMAWTV